jgi:UDPglucose 6-dehydrogenase
MDLVAKVDKRIQLCDSPYATAEGADALILATEWNEFKQVDFSKIKATMKTPILIDGRNLYDPETIKSLGFTYIGIGRGSWNNS